MMAHYDDDAFLALLDAPEPDPHIAECAECRMQLDEYRAVTSSLADASVWNTRPLDESPNPQTIANLRAFATAQRTDDEAADPLVAELLAGPREEWMPRLLANDSYRTAGVVRKLMEASDKAIDVMPPDALEISALATEIADKLDPTAYPSDTVMKLRGNAWRDRGYCLYLCSRFGDALAATTHANACFKVTSCEYDGARVGIVASLVLRAFDRLDEAMAVAALSRTRFAAYGDAKRLVSATIAQAQTSWRQGETRAALAELKEVLSIFPEIDEDTHARVLSNMAWLYTELGDSETALALAEAGRFNRNADETDDLRLRWNVAIVLARNGMREEARRRYRELMHEFESRAMLSEAAQVALCLAEVYLVDEQFDDVAELCRGVVACYVGAGVPTSGRALTALAYLQEAAVARRVKTTEVSYVREYLGRLNAEPTLFFAPPPF